MQTIPNLEQHSEAPAAGTRPVPRSAPGLVALEGGRVQRGVLRGEITPAEGDLIFTTAATGWGEILTDPSYAGQIVVLTHPMAGNYRIAAAELESSRVHARALICSRLVTPPSGPGISLEELLVDAGIPALTGIDTRALTLELRRGVQRRAVIRVAEVTDEEAVAEAGAIAPWASVDHVAGVGTRDPYTVGPEGERIARATLVDYGVKRSLLAALAARGLEITVLPPDAGAADILAGVPGPHRPVAGARRPCADGPADRDGAGTGQRGDRRAVRRSSASAWATSCWRSARARRRTVCRSGTTGAITRCSRHRAAASTSARTTTRWRSSTDPRWRRPAMRSATGT